MSDKEGTEYTQAIGAKADVQQRSTVTQTMPQRRYTHWEWTDARGVRHRSPLVYRKTRKGEYVPKYIVEGRERRAVPTGKGVFVKGRQVYRPFTREDAAYRATQLSRQYPELSSAEALGAAYAEQSGYGRAEDISTARSLARTHRIESAEYRESIAKGMPKVEAERAGTEAVMAERARVDAQVTEKMGVYGTLTGRQQFEKGIEFGFIPEGSIYLNEKRYLPPLPADELKKINPELFKLYKDSPKKFAEYMSNELAKINKEEEQAKQYADWTADELIHGRVIDGLYTPSPFGVKGDGLYIPYSDWANQKIVSDIQQHLLTLQPFKEVQEVGPLITYYNVDTGQQEQKKESVVSYDVAEALKRGTVSPEAVRTVFGQEALVGTQEYLQEMDEYEAKMEKYNEMERRLSPYSKLRVPLPGEPNVLVNDDGELKPASPIVTYDVGKALVDGVVAQDELLELGYDKDELDKAEKYAEVGAKQYIPVYGTVALWDVMTPAEKGLSIGIEALTLVPVLGWYGKVGQLGLKALAAEAGTLRAASRAAALAGKITEAVELEARAAKVLRPVLAARMGNVGKSLLYGTEEIVTSPVKILHKAVLGPERSKMFAGLGEVFTDPIRHPVNTLKGLGAVVSGKVPIGEPFLIQAGRILSPGRAYPEAAFTQITETGVPRVPLSAGRAASLEGAQGVIVQSAEGQEVIRVLLPNGQLFEVPITPYQKIFGPKFLHATPTIEAYRGLGIEIGKGGQYSSPWLSRQWTYTTARGTPGITHGALVYDAEVPKQFVRPGVSQVGKWSGPYRTVGGGAELETTLAPGTKVTIGEVPEATIRVFGQKVTILPAQVGVVPVADVMPTPATLLQKYKLKAWGALRQIGRPFKAAGAKGTKIYEVEIPDTKQYGVVWDGKLKGDIFDPETGNLLQSVQVGNIRRRVTALVLDDEGRVLLGSDKVEPKGFFDLPGGRIDPEGKFGKTVGVKGISIEGSAHGQVKSEFGFGLYDTERLPIYSGKVNQHSLPGSYVVKAKPMSTTIDRFKYTPKGKRAELKDAIWWDGKTEIRTSPATYDILKGLNEAGIIKVDLSKVKIYQSTLYKDLAKFRDGDWGKRLVGAKKIPKTRIMTPSEVDEVARTLMPEEAKIYRDVYRGYLTELMSYGLIGAILPRPSVVGRDETYPSELSFPPEESPYITSLQYELPIVPERVTTTEYKPTEDAVRVPAEIYEPSVERTPIASPRVPLEPPRVPPPPPPPPPPLLNEEKTTVKPPRDELEYQEQVAKITPGTIVHVQGRPTGGAMYKVLPPPYTDEAKFTMRQPPPGYVDEGWTGKGSAFKSVQVIGGLPPENVENIDLGIMKINVNVEGGKPVISYVPDEEANIGLREETIGMGEGQIPLDTWKQAKEEGLSKEAVTSEKVEGGWFTAQREGSVINVDYDMTDKEAEERGIKPLVPFEGKAVSYDEALVKGQSLVPKSEYLISSDSEAPDLVEEQPALARELAASSPNGVRYAYRDVTQPTGESRLTKQAMEISESEDEDEDDRRKRLRKPKQMKDWWDSPYYNTASRAATRRMPERTYYGHKLLPPDLGGSL